ncbi:MAG: type II toxin-antitoxin system HicB family antitoxin [Candidatus Babeliales bacterium]|jgi:predicted RNase H-like HicB family nuclease
MESKKKYKSLQHYLNLPWTYTVEKVCGKGKEKLYVVRVNELPGICTDAPSLDMGMDLIKEPMKAAFEFYMENGEEIPEPVNEEDFKGNIAYRTTSRRHFLINKEAQKKEISLSQVIDNLVDTVLMHKRM